MNKLKDYFKWFMHPTVKTSFPSNMDKIQKLKKKIKNLEFRVEGLESEIMFVMKEHRSLINALESRIDILNEDCEKCTKN